jgi:chaperonin cofactor prefoldin
MAENNNTTDTFNVESESLEAHVAVCSLRYQNLDDKLNAVKQNLNDKLDAVSENVDGKFTNLKDEIGDMKDSVKALTDALAKKTSATDEKWFSVGTYVIGGLLSVCGALVLHFLH